MAAKKIYHSTLHICYVISSNTYLAKFCNYLFIVLFS